MSDRRLELFTVRCRDLRDRVVNGNTHSSKLWTWPTASRSGRALPMISEMMLSSKPWPSPLAPCPQIRGPQNELE